MALLHSDHVATGDWRDCETCREYAKRVVQRIPLYRLVDDDEDSGDAA